LSIPTLARGVTAKLCRSYSIGPNYNQDEIDEIEMNICCVCLSEPRKVVFNCGHCATCVDCSKKTLFGIDSFDNTYIPFSNQSSNQKYACPICRAEVSSLIELNIEL
jgi:hypothetical protein